MRGKNQTLIQMETFITHSTSIRFWSQKKREKVFWECVSVLLKFALTEKNRITWNLIIVSTKSIQFQFQYALLAQKTIQFS